MENNNTFSLTDEMGHAEFGDKRITSRLTKLLGTLTAGPGDSFPVATGSVAGLEATYRFLGNDKVTPEKILAPHIAATLQRTLGAERVVVPHDTTRFNFPGEGRQDEIGWSVRKNQGFQGHFALAVSRNGAAVCPLGVVAINPIFRFGKPKGKEAGKKDVKRESLRWGKQISQVEKLFHNKLPPIHVMDREADDFELFSLLSLDQIRFVLRLRRSRKQCQILGQKEKGYLYDLLEGLNVITEREVWVSKRGEAHYPNHRKIHPKRASRIAKLQITAATIEVPRPSTQNLKELPEKCWINCVQVLERDTPQGEEPVHWRLFSNEPITTEEDVLNIIDDYRCRWMIEEYFKALKSGCQYEKRQLETKKTLLNALAVFAPIAWQLLYLRSQSRQFPDGQASQVLTKTQIVVLKRATKKALSESPTIGEAVLAIAALGGHIPSNGPPGWQVLGRGFETLLTLELGWILRDERCDLS